MLDRSQPDDAVVASFKKAMRRLTSTISIIATDEGSERFGMVATAVSSVSSDPPAILVCINRSASICEPLLRRRRFSVNLLRSDQSHLIPVFSGKVPSRERFAYGTWDERHALPFLAGAQANLFCDVDGQFAYGSHEVVIGRVRAASAADAISPLLWQDGMPAGACALPELRVPANSLHEAGLATPA
ncbi:flavin reductase [Burkholderia multivorans]|uniref:flavin reductase family protein n=1 Tax=Burkholderia ubonensis TaxID=101571 RepID=UPI000F6C6A19|nr:flavin reductase family protein [Burkholderia ubonensis]AYZ68216.1 flavin reductase [Burkholderia multivorans]VWC19964.1 flavin reductase domain-containing protein [Burkholderia ubonensis]